MSGPHRAAAAWSLLATALAAVALADVPAAPRPAPRHVKYADVVVGPDPHVVVATVCITKEGKFEEAHVSLSSGDDDTDDRALAIVRLEKFEPLVRSGKPRPTCLQKVIQVPPAG